MLGSSAYIQTCAALVVKLCFLKRAGQVEIECKGKRRFTTEKKRWKRSEPHRYVIYFGAHRGRGKRDFVKPSQSP